MFRIADGREAFYQWDLDRQVIVDDPSIVEVHFCNRTDECSLVTEVIDGSAMVPNILLQSNFELRVFGYDGKATLHEKKFKVIARTRPADYVYTETDVLSVRQLEEELRNDIDERLENIENEIINNLPIYEIVVPAEGELITDARTNEILTTCHDSKVMPLCTYNGVLLTEWSRSLSKQIRFTFLKPQVLARDDLSHFTEYDLTFEHKTDGWLVKTKRETKRYHYTKTSQLENDAEFTTKAYVDDAIANIEVSGGGSADLTGYATEAYVDEAIADLTDEIVEADLADKSYVDNAIAAIPSTDLTDYYTKEEIDALLSNLPAGDYPNFEEAEF